MPRSKPSGTPFRISIADPRPGMRIKSRTITVYASGVELDEIARDVMWAMRQRFTTTSLTDGRHRR